MRHCVATVYRGPRYSSRDGPARAARRGDQHPPGCQNRAIYRPRLAQGAISAYWRRIGAGIVPPAADCRILPVGRRDRRRRMPIGPTSAAPRGSDIPSPGPPRGVPCVNGREPIEAPGRCAARRSARRRPPRRSPARDSHASTTAPRGAATLPYVCAVLTRRAPAWPWASRGRGPVESPPYCLGERSRCLGTYQH